MHQKVVNTITSELCDCPAGADHVEDNFLVDTSRQEFYGKSFADAVREEKEAEALARAVGTGARVVVTGSGPHRKGGNRRR